MTAAHPTTFTIGSQLDQPVLSVGAVHERREPQPSPAIALAIMTGTSFALWAGILLAFLF